MTVLSTESWQKTCDNLRTELPWTTRRANLLVDGISFSSSDVDKVLKIGDVRLRITGETIPCYRMDQAYEGLKDALIPDWRGGVYCSVLSSGHISIDELVEICKE